MKQRMLDVMGEALGLVRKSNLSEATALLMNALSGERVPGNDAGARNDAIGAATRLPPPSPVAEPPYLLRKAQPQGETRASESDVEPERERRSGPAVAPRARRPLGEVLRGLRVVPAFTPGSAEAPGPRRHDFGERFTSRVYRGAAGSVSYRLYVPADRERRNLALVLMLHGCTQNPEDFALGTQMNRLADEFGLIVAYPHQPRRANASGCWNWFDPRHQTRGSGEPATLAGLAHKLAVEFGVKKGRIFAAGLSAGGAMAEILAETYPDVFEAVGVHSGLPYRSALDLPSAFAAMKGTAAVDAAPRFANGDGRHSRKIVFHGGADQTVHPVNGERIRDQVRRGSPLKRSDIDEEAAEGGVRHIRLQDADGETVAEHWFVESGGHAWFGGDGRGSFTQSVGLDASRIMVRFFLKP